MKYYFEDFVDFIIWHGSCVSSNPDYKLVFASNNSVQEELEQMAKDNMISRDHLYKYLAVYGANYCDQVIISDFLKEYLPKHYFYGQMYSDSIRSFIDLEF